MNMVCQNCKEKFLGWDDFENLILYGRSVAMCPNCYTRNEVTYSCPVRKSAPIKAKYDNGDPPFNL